MAPSPDWQPLEDSAVASLTTEVGAKIVEASKYSGGGGAWTTCIPAAQTIDKRYVEQFVQGYISGAAQKGQRLVKQEPVVVDRLKGVYVESKGSTAGYETGIVSFLLFTERDVYTISIIGGAGISRDHPTTKSYLSRLRVDPSVIPAEIDKDSAYELGKKVGELIARLIMIGVVISVVVTVVVAMRKRHKSALPPPLP